MVVVRVLHGRTEMVKQSLVVFPNYLGGELFGTLELAMHCEHLFLTDSSTNSLQWQQKLCTICQGPLLL